MLAFALPQAALADSTVDFDAFAAGTTITTQYSSLGVVFGPLPGGVGQGFAPVVRTPPTGQAQSGTNVADIVTCTGGGSDCEFVTPVTTGTFTVPHSHISVDAGLLGPSQTCTVATDPGCAVATLTGYDSAGHQVATSAATMVKQGAGVHTVLSISTTSATILGFKISARTDGSDVDKAVAIDNLTFDTPVAAPTPDFSLTPAQTDVDVVQGASATDAVTIGRIGGSTGNIDLAVSGAIPPGVHAVLSPNPAPGAQATLTVTADPTAAPTLGSPGTITVTGAPATPTAGTAPRTFSITVQVKQAFSVQIEGSTSVSLAGCTVSVPVEVIRDFGFAGPVSLAVTGLPPGVTGSFNPSQATFPNGEAGQIVSLDLVAPQTGQGVQATTATVHATAAGLPEQTATFSVGGTCAQQYDPEVISMQITQGTQLPVLPGRDPANPANPIPYSSLASSAAAGSLQDLAKLAAFKTTVVRVYADLRYGPSTGIPVPAVLTGFRTDVHGNPVALPGGPILPIQSPSALYPGTASLGSDFLQDNYSGVYTFVLPASWESGKIKLVAKLLPTESGAQLPPTTTQASLRPAAIPGQTAYAPCTTSDCQTDGTFALSEIQFYYTFGVTIRPLAMIQTNPYDATLPDPDTVFQWAQTVTPIPLTIEPYAATIDIGDQLGKDNSSGQVTTALLNKMLSYVCNHGAPQHGWDVGVEHNDIRSAKATGYCWQGLPIPQKTYYDFAFVNAPEPLVSVSHELYHLLGRPHASACNGAAVGINGTGTQPAEDWPPDQRGYLQSVGLAPGPQGFPYPYEVIPISASTTSGQWYDFMSYCDQVSDANPLATGQNAWISVHNWNAVMATFGYIGASTASARAARPVARAARAVPSLQVTASVAPGGKVTIEGVTPVKAPPEPASNSPFHLIASGAKGHKHVDVPMLTAFGHIDSRPPLPTLTLEAVVPAANVTAVTVASGGKTLAMRRQSAHAPTVELSQPPRIHGHTALVRWRAADRDHNPLDIEIDYAATRGGAWNMVWMGPNRGRVSLPARYFSRAQHARIRVVASDGFRTTTAVSRAFRSAGAAPSVHILTPRPNTQQPNGAPLVLTGQAFDDAGHVLSGHQLHWMLGKRLLGTGSPLTVTNLPAGPQRIRLVARDRFGRQASATVVVGLTATQPMFLTLQGPRTLARSAQTVPLSVSSSQDATLIVSTAGVPVQRFTVGRRTRRISIRIPSGPTAIAVRLALTAGGETSTELVSLRR